MSALRIFKTGAVAMLASVAACDGSSGGETTYTVGGTVIGLESGGTLEVANGSGSLAVTSNGAFTLPAGVANGGAYTVTVGTLPAGQSCNVSNATGVISSANVTNVEVYCTYNVSAATLDGAYDIAAFDINSDTDQLYTGVPFDGNGTQGSSTVITNQAGTFTTATATGGSYTVTTAVALPVLTVDTNNAGAIAGADGDEFYWIDNDVSGGSPPALVLGVKPLQAATLSTLAGNWITVGLTQATTPYDSEGSITIGADGAFSGSQSTLDLNGAANAQTVSGPANSYTVANNAVSVGGDSGYISANGEFVVLTSATQQPGGASANYPGLIAAVKQGTGVTLATLTGVYSIGSLGFASASTGTGGSLTFYFDGAGNFSGAVAANDDGTYSTGTASGTYTVTSAGVLTLTDSNGNVYTGGVTADGNIIVAAYLTSGTPAPQILVGFRQ